MCGLLGFFQVNKDHFNNENIDKFNRLLDNLNHRGPDNKDYYVDGEKKFYLGHTRLSIIDLSKSSNQPIISSNKKFVMVFNGEIYNYLELYNRISHLEISDTIKNSDTKILLEHISHFGLSETLKITNGMFAIGLYNFSKKKLFLARDYWGKKPLYIYFNEKKIFFSSTIAPIIKSRIIKNKINKNALNEYFNQGYIVSHDGSIIENIKQVKPNSIIEFEISDECIYNINEFQIHQKLDQNNSIFNIDELENKIIKSIDLRLKSDVNAGILLSSGIDSSLVASISSKINKKIDSFSVGFSHIYKDKNNDETQIASKISKKLGIQNHKLTFDKNDIVNFIDTIVDTFDEPFADSSQVASMMVFSKISKGAKVAITGDGGDEIFYGYNRYKYYIYWDKGLKFLKPILKILNNTSLKNILYKKINYKLINQFEKFINIFIDSNQIKYSDFIRLSFNDEIVKLSSNIQLDNSQFIGNLEDLRNFDIKNYMAYDILTKIDRSSMRYSVEARSPLLDINIFNYLKSSNIGQSINFFTTKILLKKILKKYLPSNLINTSKKGFSIPIDRILLEEVKNDYYESYEYVNKNGLIDNLHQDVIKNYMNLFFVKHDYRYTSLIWACYIYFKWLIKYESFLDFE